MFAELVYREIKEMALLTVDIADYYVPCVNELQFEEFPLAIHARVYFLFRCAVGGMSRFKPFVITKALRYMKSNTLLLNM